jgi:tRNA A-37 threonylcarbamoyl transferase component Bud32
MAAGGDSGYNPVSVADDPSLTQSGNLNTGARLGRCRVERVLATGGMGTIYLAHHESLDKTVVLKVLPPNLAADPEYQKRFLREARAAAKLEHPNIVQIYDAATEADMPYIIMQFIEGQDLQVLLDKKGRAPIGDALSITKKVAQALAFAHKQGIVHRDIKPSNIMISKQGKVMVTDFGLARQISGTMSATVTQGGIVLGTPDYISPEQAMGERTDGRTDIYSLGCMLYRMLAGRPPYEDPNPVTIMMKHVRDSDQPEPIRKVNPDVPEVVEKLLDRMMRKNPSERFATMDDVVVAIDGCKGKAGAGSRVETSPVPQATIPTLPLPAVGSKRSLGLIIAASVVGTIVLLFLLGFLLRPSPAQRALNEARNLEKREGDWLAAALTAYRSVERNHAGTPQAAEARALGDALELRLANQRIDAVEADYKASKATFADAASRLRDLRASPHADIVRRVTTTWESLSKLEILARAKKLCELLVAVEKSPPGADREKLLDQVEDFVDPADLNRFGKRAVRLRFEGMIGLLRLGKVSLVSLEAKADSVVVAADGRSATLTLVIQTKTKEGEIKPGESPAPWVVVNDAWYVDFKEK